MRRALFLLQFRRNIVPYLTIFLALDLAMAMVEWSYQHFGNNPLANPGVVDKALAAIALGLAIPAGASAFSRDYKEKQHFFLHSLPQPLNVTWGIIFGANFSVLLCSLALMLVFRPSVAGTVYWEVLGSSLLGGAAILATLWLLYAAGSCSALCFRKDLLGYLVAFFGSAVSLGAVYSLSLVCSSDPASWWRSTGLHAGFLCTGIVACAVVLTWLSLRFFIRGEVFLLQVQVRHMAHVFASLCSVLIVMATALDFGLFSRFDSWSFRGEATVSPDGRHLLVIERRFNHPQFGRATFLDTQTGSILRQVERAGLVLPRVWWWRTQFNYWSGDFAIMKVADNLPWRRLLYLLPPSEGLARISQVSAPRETRFPSAAVNEFHALADGKVLASLITGDRVRAVYWDPTSQQVSDAFGGHSSPRLPYWYRQRDGLIVAFQNPPSLWRLEDKPSGPIEKQISASSKPTSEALPSCVIDDQADFEPPDCRRKIADLYPPPASAERRSSGYVLSNGILVVNQDTPIFFRVYTPNGTSTLLVCRRRNSPWTKVAENVHGASVSREIAAYGVQSPTGFEVYFYDARRERTERIGAIEDTTGSVPLVRFEEHYGIDYIEVDRGGTSIPVLVARYDPGSGHVRTIKLGADHRQLLFADEAGNHISYRLDSQTPHRIVRVNADGSERVLWPPT